MSIFNLKDRVGSIQLAILIAVIFVIEIKYLRVLGYKTGDVLNTLYPYFIVSSISFAISFIDRNSFFNGLTLIVFSLAAIYIFITGNYSFFLLALFFLVSLHLVIYRGAGLTSFIYIYCILAIVLYLPHLHYEVSISKYYKFVSIIFLLMSTYLFSIKREKELILPRYLRYIIYLVVILLGYHAIPFNFVFDDLNGYLWIPYVSVSEDHTFISEFRPSSLTFYSVHNIGFATYLSYLFQDVTPISFIYSWKFFQFFLFSLFFVLFLKEFLYKKRFLFIFLISLFPSYLNYQIAGNQNDFTLILSIWFSIYFILNNHKIKPHHFLLFALLVTVNFKSSVPLITLLIVYYYNNFNELKQLFKRSKFYLFSILGIVFISPIYIRNYYLTGNPTFPSGNNYFQSSLFPIDSFVASKYKLGTSGFNEFWDLIFNSSSDIIAFYAPEYSLYGSLIVILFFIVLITYMFYGKVTTSSNINHFKLFLFSFLSYLICINLVGAQHRYLATSVFFFAYFLSSFILFKTKKQYLLVIQALIFPSFAIPLGASTIDFTSSPPQYEGKHFSSNISFYAKVNSTLRSSDKIILYYVQDKIFINNPNLIELDWYDYVPTKQLQDYADSLGEEINIKDRANSIKNNLCLNNYTHFILSPDVYPWNIDVSSFSKLLSSSSNRRFYKINCD